MNDADPKERDAKKPGIVAHRPVLRAHNDGDAANGVDTDSSSDRPSESDKEKMAHSAGVTLTPIESFDESDGPKNKRAGTPDRPTEEEAPDTGGNDTVAEPPPKTDRDIAPASPPANENIPDKQSPSSANPAKDAKQQEEAEAAEKAERDRQVQGLITSRRYELPIKTVEDRQTRRFVLLGTGLAVILIVLWLDIALDAGLIHMGGLHAPTHFFSN